MSDTTVGHSMRGVENIDATLTDHKGIDVKKLYHGDLSVMKSLRRALESVNIVPEGSLNDIRIMILGITGSGKSALVNSILEKEVAEEGGEIGCCTKVAQQYYHSDVVPGVNVTLIDTPSLQNGKEQLYIQELRDKVRNVTMVLFCMKITEQPFNNKAIMQKLREAFGPKFWEKVVFVLTFANKENCSRRDSKDEPEPDPEPSFSDEKAWQELKKKRFTCRVSQRKKAISSFVKSTFGINDTVFTVAGIYKPSNESPDPKFLPDSDDWLADFLTLCCREIKEKHVFSKLCLSNSMTKFSKALEETGSDKVSATIDILIIGVTGSGKSALVNSILGDKIAVESAKNKNCTKNVQQFSFYIHGVNVTIIDTPGLQDLNEKEQTYIQEMKNGGQAVSLILYCFEMKEHRLKNDDKAAMQKLHQAFGSKFWERVVFVLTFANDEKCDLQDDRDDPTDPDPALDDEEGWNELEKKRFKHRIKLKAEAIWDVLCSSFHMQKVPVIPVGYWKERRSDPSPMVLPDRVDWLLELLKSCCREVKETHKFSRLVLNNKTNFAIIIDNHGECKEGDETSNQIAAVKKAFENLGFCVLYFNQLRCQPIFTLLEAFKEVDQSQLASFALIFLSTGDTNHLRDAANETITFERILAAFSDVFVPKIFLFHLACPGEATSDRLDFVRSPPNNSIALVVSVKQSGSTSPALASIINNLDHDKCHMQTLKQCFETIETEIKTKFNKSICSCVMPVSTLQDNFVLSAHCKLNDLQTSEAEYHILYAMWYPIRCKTIEELLEKKDHVMTLVKRERIGNVVSSTVGLIGAGAVAIGMLFAIPTFGTSLSLSAIGGGVGIAGAGGGLASSYLSKKMNNSHLAEAQSYVTLDQQFSKQLNAATARYAEALESWKKNAVLCGASIAARLLNAARLGNMLSDGGEIVARISARVVGVTLMAVTVPFDIGVIAYNCSRLRKASKNTTGLTDDNQTIQCLLNQFKDSLKGFFQVVDTHEYNGDHIHAAKCGYKVMIPTSSPKETFAITISTIVSGPFHLPEGSILASAVYDVMIDKVLKTPITIKIEHCVDVSDESVAEKLSFATAVPDLTEKAFKLEITTGGTFINKHKFGSITVCESCLLCVLITEPLQLKAMKYAVQCSYTKRYLNFWTIKATFTKHLSAYSKYIQMDFVEDPKENPKENPNEDPKENPNEDPKEKPKEDSKEDPKEDPNEDPKESPNKDPNKDPKENPNKDPNEDSNEHPKEDPNEDPNENPNEDPNVYPFHFSEPHVGLQNFKETKLFNGWTVLPNFVPNEPILKTSLDAIGLIYSGISLKRTIPYIELNVTKSDEAKEELNTEIEAVGTNLKLPIKSYNFFK